MKWKRWGKQMAGFLAVMLLCLSICPGRVYAYGMIDTEEPVSLSLSYSDNGSGIADVSFSLYRIADLSETAGYTLTGEFTDYPVSLENLDSSGWRRLAQTLEGYVLRDAVTPLQTESTDENGRLLFADLRPGLFLVIGETAERMNSTYIPETFICSLPGLAEDDTWQYSVEADVKYESVSNPVPVSREIVKVWENDNKNSRPEEIEVQLLKDGTVVDTQKLNAANNWRYTWANLDSAAKWTAVEKNVPAGYSVSVECEGTEIVITNTGTEEKTPGTAEERLPQTGVLWWPVPVLAAAGLLLFLAGWIRRRRQENEKK